MRAATPKSAGFTALRRDYEKFFTDYDRFRYQNERHLPACIDALNVAGKQVLEIGLGEGADSERLIRRGAPGRVST